MFPHTMHRNDDGRRRACAARKTSGSLEQISNSWAQIVVVTSFGFVVDVAKSNRTSYIFGSECKQYRIFFMRIHVISTGTLYMNCNNHNCDNTKCPRLQLAAC
ncbi:hypothetical protein EVAR_58910_1 [Eumeta japonica]|uniref:Uncharacterized protein n=1 Tax=Eumeta variegata TaxID=151549 RepID=A0A4C1YAA9_EUMVA|nr:hypothetical protein EVAR_58910_1 [Eumeta japonica]